MGARSPSPTATSKLSGPLLPRKWENVGDFWNDPRRWDDVDPFKECFWSVRRPDVIDVRPAPAPPRHPAQQDPYANAAWQYGITDLHNLMNTRPGSIIRYTPY